MAVTILRIGAGLVFVVAGILKFAAHGAELEAFMRFGLPAPDFMVYATGVFETAGGALLVLGRLIRPAAALLACTMAAAIAVSGIKEGDLVPSLTLAPVLLAIMLFLLFRRPAPRRL